MLLLILQFKKRAGIQISDALTKEEDISNQTSLNRHLINSLNSTKITHYHSLLNSDSEALMRCKKICCFQKTFPTADNKHPFQPLSRYAKQNKNIYYKIKSCDSLMLSSIITIYATPINITKYNPDGFVGN